MKLLWHRNLVLLPASDSTIMMLTDAGVEIKDFDATSQCHFYSEGFLCWGLLIAGIMLLWLCGQVRLAIMWFLLVALNMHTMLLLWPRLVFDRWTRAKRCVQGIMGVSSKEWLDLFASDAYTAFEFDGHAGRRTTYYVAGHPCIKRGTKVEVTYWRHSHVVIQIRPVQRR